MTKELTLGYSPCPNDTFIFHALVHNLIDTDGLSFKEELLDVEALNKKALASGLDITKVSYHAFAFLREGYCLIRSGGAMGRGCGPLIVAREDFAMKDLRGKRIAIPGRLTTAFLLLQLYDPALGENIKVMRFDEIMDAVRNKDVDAGLIIHESRFTYPDYGLKCTADLGRWWEDETGLPLPLGCILAKRSLAGDIVLKTESLIRESILHAMSGPDETMGYIKKHSQELSDKVIREHIGLYVNDYSLDIGDEGIKAVNALLRMAEDRGLIIKGTAKKPFFI